MALTPEQAASPLAARPYGLRHAALSSWLNPGEDPIEVAERAGNSVEVLLSRYAKCLDGRQGVANSPNSSETTPTRRTGARRRGESPPR